MRNELYQKIKDKYWKKHEGIEKGVKKRLCRFRDIASNLLAGCELFLLDYEQENKKGFVENIRALRDYFRLLEKHPDFKKDELSKEKGHFNEFDETKNEGFRSYKLHYIAYAKEKLEKKVSEDNPA